MTFVYLEISGKFSYGIFEKQTKSLPCFGGVVAHRGLVQIGVIQSLIDKGYEIDEVVGSSIGSLVGAAYVQGNLGSLEESMLKITKRQVFRLLDFTNPKFGLLKGERIFDALKDIMPDVPIEEMRIPFRAIATDMLE